MTTSPTPNAALTKESDWIEWTGGKKSPVGDAVVEVKKRLGHIETGNRFDWAWTLFYGSPDDDDIIAYRLATPSPAVCTLAGAAGQDALGVRADTDPRPSPAAPSPDRHSLEPTPLGDGWFRDKDGDKFRIPPAQPEPAAQDDPAKGLEVVAWVVTAEHQERQPSRDLLFHNQGGAAAHARAKQWRGVPGVYKVSRVPLTNHATATRQIAERDARVAELREAVLRGMDMNRAIDAERLAAEADAARVSRVLEAIKARAVNSGGNWYGDRATEALAALTQRGA